MQRALNALIGFITSSVRSKHFDRKAELTDYTEVRHQ